MKADERWEEPVSDPELRAALSSLEGEPPLEAVDWSALQRSIGARAELPLARRRRGAQPLLRPPAARARQGWRPLLPLAVAASIALVVWTGGGGETPEAAVGQLSPEEVFEADLSEQEFRLLVSGGADPEELLLIALGER